MTKFFLKKEQLDFMKGWITSSAQMGNDDDDDDVLANVAIINDVMCDGLWLCIDHVISIISDEEANEEDK